MTTASATGTAPPSPHLREIVGELVAEADARAPAGPYVIGIVGSVAVGKTTFAARLADLMATGTRTVEVVSTDSFLLSNAVLEPMGGAMVKGTPQSYDWGALERFLRDAAEGADELHLPVYSHELFDVVPDEVQVLPSPDVLVVEGLNLLQQPPTSPVDVSAHLHRSIYLHAPRAVIEEWFVERFMTLTRHAASTPGDFYSMFAGLDEDEVESIAVWTWAEINAPNLADNIEPTRSRADLVVHHGADHSIERIERHR